MKKKLKLSIWTGLCLVLLLSGGCGSRGQVTDRDTEEQGLTEDMGETGTEEGQPESSDAETWDSTDNNGYYYNLEAREAEFVDYFLGEGTYEQEPYFSYVNPEGELQVKLWHDEASDLWCGIRYAVTESEGDAQYPYGFVMEGESDRKEVGGWDLEPMEEVLSVDDFMAEYAADPETINNVKENIEQDDSGRLLSYKVTGDYVTYDYEKGEDVVRESEWLYSIDYIYYDNGITEKTYAHNISHFGTLGHFNDIVYDEKDREIYSRFFYASLLSGETYYFYEKDSDIPYGYLFIDEGTQGVPARVVFDAHLEDVTFDGNADLIISLGGAGVHGTPVACAYVYENDTFVITEEKTYQQYYDENGDLQEIEVD